MTTCEFDQEALTLHASGDLTPSEARKVEDHLTGCAACAREHAAIAATLAALDPARLYPREAEVDWDRFAARTVALAQGEAEGRVLPFRERTRQWTRPAILARAAAVVLAAGLGAFLLLQPVGPLAPPEVAGSGSEMPIEFQQRLEVNLAQQNTRQYLEQSRAVLINVLESPVRCAKNEIDIAAEREKSRQLLRRKKLLRDDLTRPELARALDLCNQLEGILTEISTLKNCADLERIQELRDAVRRNQLLVKIGVMEEELGGMRV